MQQQHPSPQLNSKQKPNTRLTGDFCCWLLNSIVFCLLVSTTALDAGKFSPALGTDTPANTAADLFSTVVLFSNLLFCIFASSFSFCCFYIHYLLLLKDLSTEIYIISGAEFLKISDNSQVCSFICSYFVILLFRFNH